MLDSLINREDREVACTSKTSMIVECMETLQYLRRAIRESKWSLQEISSRQHQWWFWDFRLIGIEQHLCFRAKEFRNICHKEKLKCVKYTLSFLKTRDFFESVIARRILSKRSIDFDSLDCFLLPLVVIAMTDYFFLPEKYDTRRTITPAVMAMSAILNTEKYCTLIKSVTEPNSVRSIALSKPPVPISRYPVFSFSEIFLHPVQSVIPNQISIRGMIQVMPGSAVPKATPVFFTWCIPTKLPIIENWGSEVCAQYFVRISVRLTIKTNSNLNTFP